MIVRDQLSHFVVDWVQRVFTWDNETVGSKVMREERGRLKGPSPPLPYLTYDFLLVDMPNGMDETTFVEEGYGITGGRIATLTFAGYGEGAGELLTKLSYSTRPELTDPLTILNLGPMLDISGLDEDTIEARYTKDFTVLYRIRTPDEEVVVPETWATTVRYNDEDIEL